MGIPYAGWFRVEAWVQGWLCYAIFMVILDIVILLLLSLLQYIHTGRHTCIHTVALYMYVARARWLNRWVGMYIDRQIVRQTARQIGQAGNVPQNPFLVLAPVLGTLSRLHKITLNKFYGDEMTQHVTCCNRCYCCPRPLNLRAVSYPKPKNLTPLYRKPPWSP